MKRTIIAIALLALLVLAGCAQPIAEAKLPENVGETVKVKGEVTAVVSIGELSGYVLRDKAGDDIAVATEDLPAKGDTVTAKGTLRRDLLIYYIEEN